MSDLFEHAVKKEDLKKELTSHHQNFLSLLQFIPLKNVTTSFNQKWSAAQQLDHIVRSVSPVRLAFSLPSFVLKLVFGSANRPSQNQDELIAKYKTKLAAGGKASKRFIPPKKTASTTELSNELHRLINSLCKKIDSFSEGQLDQLILPHPLLGKLTLREMLYFTIYHVQHHQLQVKKNTPSL